MSDTAQPVSEPPTGSGASEYGRAGRDLPAAITVGVLLVLAIAFTLWQWHWGFVLLATAALLAACVEIYGALQRIGMRAAIGPILVGTVLIVIGSYFAGHHPQLEGVHWTLSSVVLLVCALGITTAAALIWRMPAGPEGYVRDVAASLFIIAYVPLLGSFVTLMLAGEQGALRVLAFILCVSGSDTGGYIAGVLFGRHKMAPVISPKKTWEGLAGSVVLSMTAGALVTHFLLGVGAWVGLVLGLVCTVVGTCGDLVESMIKRDIGMKDMSSFLPGHGGIMDRLDSLLVAAPAAYLALYLMVPGG